MTSHSLFVSIIIPTHERPGQLAECLESVCRLNYPLDRFEAIVVDDGSETLLEKVVGPFRDLVGLRLIRQPNSGPAQARNTGASHAQGQLLAFIDDDCRPAVDWLAHMVAHVRRMPGRAIGGRTVNALPRNLYSTASQALNSLLYDYLNPDSDNAAFFAANNLIVPADRFRELGGFNPEFHLPAGEDREFCDRWLRQGYSLAYASDAVVYHAHPLNLQSFWRQQFGYGRGNFYYYRERSHCGSGMLILNTSLYIRILTFAFKTGAVSGWCRFTLAALMVVSQIAIVTGLLSEWLRCKLTSSDT